MNSTPILLLAYNRPEKLANLIESLRPHRPQQLLVSIDGPKAHKPDDAEKIKMATKKLNLINWTDQVELISYVENQGLKKAVINAVSHGMSKFGKLITLEEDVTVGPDFLNYANFMLEKFNKSDDIGHVSLYNIVPPQILSTKHSRLSIYPESVAWASWDRAWKNFDADMKWATEVSLSDLKRITGGSKSALAWKMAFMDAKNDRISTWAYRWIASMWSMNQKVISPNSNLVSYNGYDTGSHTLTKAPWKELGVSPIDFSSGNQFEHDLQADRWLSETVFRGTFSGLAKQVAVTTIRKFAQEKH